MASFCCAFQLKTIYSKSPQLAKCYVGSTIQAFRSVSAAYEVFFIIAHWRVQEMKLSCHVWPPYCLASLSEGSVIAYYVSEFHVPAGQEAAVDKEMAAMDKLVDKEQRSALRTGNSLLFDDVVSSGTVRAADMSVVLYCCGSWLCGFSVSASKMRFFFPSSRHPIYFHLVKP